MMDQLGSKLVGVKIYYNTIIIVKKVCAHFFCLSCNNFVILDGMENVKFHKYTCIPNCMYTDTFYCAEFY